MNSALHFEAIARLPEWQQRVMRCQVKTIAKNLWKAEREQNLALSAAGAGSAAVGGGGGGSQTMSSRKHHHHGGNVELSGASSSTASGLPLKRKYSRKRGRSMMDDDGKQVNDYHQQQHQPHHPHPHPPRQQAEQYSKVMTCEGGEVMTAMSSPPMSSASHNLNNPNDNANLVTSNAVVGNGTATLSTASTMPLVANSKLL